MHVFEAPRPSSYLFIENKCNHLSLMYYYCNFFKFGRLYHETEQAKHGP